MENRPLAAKEPQTQEETQKPERKHAPAAEPEPESGGGCNTGRGPIPGRAACTGTQPLRQLPRSITFRGIPKTPESREILQAARKAALEKPAPQGPSYRGELREGKPWGRGRTEQPSGATSYEGGFRDGNTRGLRRLLL